MKKILYSILAVAAVFATSACQSRLEIPQKGVTAIENFYQTDDDAEAALVAAYANFATNVTGRGAGFIYTPLRFILNNGGDDMYAAGSNFGDNDFSAAINEYRLDSGLGIVNELYSGLYNSVYTCNLVIDNFTGNNSVVAQRCVAEARVLRAYCYLVLAMVWDTPPFVDHVLSGDALPYNCDADPENPKTHEQLLQWIADECIESVGALDARKGSSDKDGAVKVTKGFAQALAGKALVFAGKYSDAKTQLKAVIDSKNYALVPGTDFWQNFHAEGDGNSEKLLESNIEYNSGIGSWGGINQRSTWMQANIWCWRSDHFVAGASPIRTYTGIDGWGGLGVPKWFADAFLAHDGHSYRFDATLISISDAVYMEGNAKKLGFTYQDDALNAMSLDEKKASDKIGIADPLVGLYGQSFYLAVKQMIRTNDVNLSYGDNVRLNNNVVMRYAEVLLLYAEACLQSGDPTGAADAINQIRNRAGLDKLNSVTMDDLKAEKMFELWLENCRWMDLVRWGDTARVEKAGSDVPMLFDKIHRAPKATDKNVTWENGTEANSRFYTVSTTEAKDAGYDCGFKKGKHEHFPFPMTVIEKNPNIRQNPGW